MLTQVYGAKVPAQLLRALTWAWCFRMGQKALICFLCYLSSQLSCAKSKSSPGCCTAARCGWLPGRVVLVELSSPGCRLPAAPACCSALLSQLESDPWKHHNYQGAGCRGTKQTQRWEPAWRMLGDRAGAGYELKKWQTLSSPQQPEAGDGLRDNYWRVILLETDYFCRLQTFNFLKLNVKHQSSCFLLLIFPAVKILRTGCASIMAAIKPALQFTSTSLNLTLCETVTKETGQTGL